MCRATVQSNGDCVHARYWYTIVLWLAHLRSPTVKCEVVVRDIKLQAELYEREAQTTTARFQVESTVITSRNQTLKPGGAFLKARVKLCTHQKKGYHVESTNVLSSQSNLKKSRVSAFKPGSSFDTAAPAELGEVTLPYVLHIGTNLRIMLSLATSSGANVNQETRV